MLERRDSIILISDLDHKSLDLKLQNINFILLVIVQSHECVDLRPLSFELPLLSVELVLLRIE